MNIVRLALLTSLLAPIASAATATAEPEFPSLSVRLSPRADVTNPGLIGTIDIAMSFSTAPIKSGKEVLGIDLVTSNVDTVASQVGDIRGRDVHGIFVLAAQIIGGATPRRIWVARRNLDGPVQIDYRIAANAVLPPRGPAVPTAASNDGGAFSSVSSIVLLLPHQKADRYAFTIDWDLSAAPTGSVGLSSLGEGKIGPVALTPEEVGSIVLMGGRIGQWPKPTGSGFFGAWQGKPSFDASEILKWTGQLHQRQASFFKARPSPYGVFLRYNPVNAGGGVALYKSFITTFGAGAGSRVDKMKMTLSHEMVHTFQPRIQDADWFNEGIAVFYEARLPLRFRMVTLDDFIADINYYAARYYTNALGNIPDKEIEPGFWHDTRIRTLAYDRGMLYLVTIDEALRRKSSGRRSLDDLVLDMLRESKGTPLSNEQWEQMLRKELGEPGVASYRAAIEGATPLPSSSAFGPCFQRTTARMRRYEVGFDPAVLGETRRIVRNLIPDSAAAHAGLRNGDEILVPVPQDRIQGEQETKLTLTIRRSGRTFLITYLPRGEWVATPQWERLPKISDSRCAI